MRKMQKPPVKEVKTSEKEPLAEGLQTFPTDPRGRRLWSRMSDEEVVEVARKFMEEKGITGRKELEKADQGLYQVLRKRGLLDEVGFVEKYRTWTEMEDEEVIEFARIFMREREISKRYGLEKADSGLYQVLRERGLLDEVGFEDKRKKERSWKSMSDEEVIEFARKVIEEKEIDGKGKLSKTEQGLYLVLLRRGLLDEVGFEKKRRKGRSWKDMSDKEIVEFARKLMEKKGITGRKELIRTDPGLYKVLRKRGLLDEVGFVEKYRTWTEMEDEEVIEFARIFMREREISKRYGLEKADSGLYQVLRERGLLNRVFARMEQQRDNSARDAVIDALSAFGAEN